MRTKPTTQTSHLQHDFSIVFESTINTKKETSGLEMSMHLQSALAQLPWELDQHDLGGISIWERTPDDSWDCLTTPRHDYIVEQKKVSDIAFGAFLASLNHCTLPA